MKYVWVIVFTVAFWGAVAIAVWVKVSGDLQCESWIGERK